MTLVTFIYLIDFLSSLGKAMGIALFILLLVCTASTLFVLIGEGTLKEHELKRGKNIFKYSAVALVVSTIMVCVIPSKTTMYMMGAAVVGQEFIKSDTGQKLQKLVEAKIDQELEEVAAKADKLKK